MSDVRVLILKDEAGRKDKIILYDSEGVQQSFSDGQYAPMPKRVMPFSLEFNARIETQKRSRSTCTVQFLCHTKE